MSNFLDVDWSSLPVPADDGATKHLAAARLVSASLRSTDDNAIDLSALAGRTVVYAYPMTGRPGVPLPEGWDMIPGARGCTPQSCSFRDHFAELRELGVDHLFGLSTQDTLYQREAAERLHLPFPLLSDHDLGFAKAMQLPTFEVDGMVLLKRFTLIIRNGIIEYVFYPIFPPDRAARDVIKWLRQHER